MRKNIVIIGSEGSLGQDIKKILLLNKDLVICADHAFSKNTNFLKKSKYLYEHHLDVKNEYSMKNFHEILRKKIKKIDGIVYTVTSKTKDFYFPIDKFSYNSWKQVIDTELGGAFLTAKYFGSTLAKQKKGSVVFISSIYGIVGNDHSIYKGSNLAKVYSNKRQSKKIFSSSAYNASKGGLISLTKFLASYWPGKNIRFNCVSPGGIKNKKENKTFVKNYSKRVPLNRKANLREVSDAVIFLISDKSNYINGHNLVVDGGFTTW